eukprot:XP_001709201.1 Hypothetical protein GL50803_21766 [Giardia lamblia ATCC 50803]
MTPIHRKHSGDTYEVYKGIFEKHQFHFANGTYRPIE